jgi:DNA-binding XRE family transcriptional regulator
MSSMNKLICSRIKQKRIELDYSLEQLGYLLGCSRQLIEHEKGFCAMPIYRLNDFAMICDLPVDWFLWTSIMY